ncbi:hypothetical protein PMIN06_010282 [Paraphaeosphaeria minitans]
MLLQSLQESQCAGKQSVNKGALQTSGCDDEILETPNPSTLDECISTAEKWLASRYDYCNEGNTLKAPYVHARPVLFRDRTVCDNLENFGAVHLCLGDAFGVFFKHAAQSKHNVRIGLFATCESNAIQLRRKQLLGSIWTFALFRKKQSTRMGILIYDPKTQLCNKDGTFQSKTRKLGKTREAAVKGYLKYANASPNVEIWHNKHAARDDDFLAVINLINGLVCKGDEPFEGDNDSRLEGFVSI